MKNSKFVVKWEAICVISALLLIAWLAHLGFGHFNFKLEFGNLKTEIAASQTEPQKLIAPSARLPTAKRD